MASDHIPLIRVPNTDELLQNLPLGRTPPHPWNSSLPLRGWFSLATSQSVHGFIRWILFLRSLSSVLDETGGHYTGTHRCLPFFLPHDHTRHYNAQCMHTGPPPGVSWSLASLAVLFVTYYCLISFLASLPYLFCSFGLVFLLNPG